MKYIDNWFARAMVTLRFNMTVWWEHHDKDGKVIAQGGDMSIAPKPLPPPQAE